MHVTSTLPCEAGVQDWSEWAVQISKWASAYYASEGRTWSQARIEVAPFEREDLRLVSYGRGMMFSANLDAAIRAGSEGKRNLLGALRPLFEARRDGQPITMARWETWLREAGGDASIAAFRRTVLVGELIAPEPDAFSSTLEAVPTSDVASGSTASGYKWRVRIPAPR
ncbi:MAG: hypothetical protein EOP37_26235 [Rubrivivax sp.]|nr:MAG: hypothetical protein EOP37_26235 [Rubrivivax sp.]